MSTFEISPLDDGGGYKLSGELDLSSARELRTRLLEVAAEGNVRLDLSELTFMDSSGLSAILDHARARNGDGPIVLLDPTPPVARLFELTSLNQHPGIEMKRRARSTVLVNEEPAAS